MQADLVAVSAGEQQGFVEFTRRVAPRYVWYPHCLAIANVLERVASGELRRVMVFMPPRHSKSETISRLFTAWYLHRFPDRTVGLCSYAAGLAFTLSRAARDNFLAGGGEVRPRASAVGHWLTARGGAMWAAGAGGPITGKGFHLGILDDPVKNAEEAGSVTLRERLTDWYASTFTTREMPNHSAIVLVQTRWHEDDLAGWLLDRERSGLDSQRWHIVCMPAIAEAHPGQWPENCTVEPDGRVEGEALCPALFSAARLRAVERQVGPRFWSALYQQRPTAREGCFLRSGWFTINDAAPARMRSRLRYWDLASAAPGCGDFTAGALMAVDEGGIYWLQDMIRFQAGPAERNRIILSTASIDAGRYGRVRIVVEQPPGAGSEVCDALVRQLAGYPVSTDRVHRDKVTRAEPFAAQAEAGNVRLVKGDWNGRFLEEVASFPLGRHDDQVDAASGAFNGLCAPGEKLNYRPSFARATRKGDA